MTDTDRISDLVAEFVAMRPEARERILEIAERFQKLSAERQAYVLRKLDEMDPEVAS